MLDHWIADRMSRIESSGIRKVFELGRDEGPGQPQHRPAGTSMCPSRSSEAAKAAIDAAPTATPSRRASPSCAPGCGRFDLACPGQDREVFVTSGTSGGVVLALCATVNPGDEVILFDPYFVAYPAPRHAGGRHARSFSDTYPDFRIDLDRVARRHHAAHQGDPRHQPCEPDRRMTTRATLRDLAQLAAKSGDLLIQRRDLSGRSATTGPFTQPGRVRRGRSGLRWFRQVLRHDGLAARLRARAAAADRRDGQAAAVHVRLRPEHRCSTPASAASTTTCRPSSPTIGASATELCACARGALRVGTAGRGVLPVPKAPWGTASEFVRKASAKPARHPGKSFSRKDTHFRISYAATDEKLRLGAEILNRIAMR